jgi:hypothetical protein
MELIDYSPEQQAQYVEELIHKLSVGIHLLAELLQKEYSNAVTIDMKNAVYATKTKPERFYELDILTELQVHTENSIYEIPLVRYDGKKFMGSKSNDELFVVMRVEDKMLTDPLRDVISEFMRG